MVPKCLHAQTNSCTKGQAKSPGAGQVVKNLIVNADDLGWTEGVNRGILEAFQGGIVTSGSLLANGVAFAEAVKAAKSAPGLGVGVHLNLSDGAPVADPETVVSLSNDDGHFAGGPERSEEHTSELQSHSDLVC